MRRIEISDGDTVEQTRIEHILSRDNHEDLQLDYSNMVLCCNGNISGECHCDVSKKSSDITFNLFSDAFLNTISYDSGRGTTKGTIKCSNNTYEDEIKNILNLNNAQLRANRSSALYGAVLMLGKGNWPKAKIAREITKWTNKDNEGKHKPYCGIVTWYLQKKLNQAVK